MIEFKNYLKGKTEFIIAVAAIILWLLIKLIGTRLGWDTYSAGYFQKIFFGIFSMSIITGVGWIWLGANFPELKKSIDPDTYEYKMLSQWERIKLGFWYYCLYVGGAVFLASLY